MRKPKIRELAEALKILFLRGPYTCKFPAEPYEAPETYRGKPAYDKDKCVGCGACARVCPARAIEVVDDPATGKRKLIVHYDICIFCGQCHAYCTTKEGIKLTHEYDLATLDRSETVETVEKDLVLCERCGGAIGAREHLAWVARRLGAQAYANPTLILAESGELPPAPPPPSAREAERLLERADLVRLLCHQCRRDIFLTEEWK
ncbi:MAG: 4Fe-4S binding protein [Planctomycetota bacterium]